MSMLTDSQSRFAMKRVTKDHQERRRELIDAAERLFLSRGYSETAVSDIVREISVAQGTFYYYFRTKEEILEAVIEKNINDLEREIRQVMSREGAGPAEKLMEMINSILHLQVSRKELIERIHEERNAVMHEKVERRIASRMAPLVAEVVRSGMAQGCFDADLPEETAELLMAAIIYLFHQPDIDADPARRERMRSALEGIMAKAFGIKAEGFSLKL